MCIQDVTVMFTDIRDYEATLRTNVPRDNFEFINAYNAAESGQ